MQAGSDAPQLSVLAAVPAVWNVVGAAGTRIQLPDSVGGEGGALADLGGEEDSDKERNINRVNRCCFAGRL